MKHAYGLRFLLAFAALVVTLPAFAGLSAVAITNAANLSLTSPAIGTPGATQTLTLTYQDVASSGLGASLDALAIAGINAGDFAIVGGTCATGTTVLNAGNPTCTVIVQYTASAAAPASAQLNATCSTVSGIGGYTVTCNNTSAQISSLAGALLAAAIAATPFLDPKLLTLLFAVLFGAGTYYAGRKQRA